MMRDRRGAHSTSFADRLARYTSFAQALQETDRLPEFSVIRTGLDRLALRHWTRAIEYFSKHATAISRVRHHVGGHFGAKAAHLAVKHLLPDAYGALEVAIYGDRGGGAKLGFASEIAATALVRNLHGNDTQEKARRLMRIAVVAYRHAVHAVDGITVAYLWDRFGK